MRFDSIVISKTIEKLLKGEDYREEVINAINLEFLDFTLDFFRQILEAKLNDESINLDWYKAYFINNVNCIQISKLTYFINTSH